MCVQITEKDEEVLAYLADLRCEELEEGGVDEEGDPLEGFKLSFHFAPNPFFDDVVLVCARTPCSSGLFCLATMPSRAAAETCMRMEESSILWAAARCRAYRMMHVTHGPTAHKLKLHCRG